MGPVLSGARFPESLSGTFPPGREALPPAPQDTGFRGKGQHAPGRRCRAADNLNIFPFIMDIQNKDCYYQSGQKYIHRRTGRLSCSLWTQPGRLPSPLKKQFLTALPPQNMPLIPAENCICNGGAGTAHTRMGCPQGAHSPACFLCRNHQTEELHYCRQTGEGA